MRHGQYILFLQKMLWKDMSRLVFAPFPCFSSLFFFLCLSIRIKSSFGKEKNLKNILFLILF